MIGPRPVKLMRYDAACKALAEAHRVDEVKNIRDKAVAMQAYAKQAKDSTLIMQATEIRMRAERRAGELLRDMAERGERAVRKNMKSQPATSKLSDLGINKTESSRWQRLAALDADSFEAKIEGASKRAYDGITYRFLKQAEIERAQHATAGSSSMAVPLTIWSRSPNPAIAPPSSISTRLGLGRHGVGQAVMSTLQRTTITTPTPSSRT